MSAEILNHLWQSTLFAGLAAVLAWAFRSSGANVRHGIWLAASLKFLIPFSLLLALGSHIGWVEPRDIADTQASVIQTIAAPASEPESAITTYVSSPRDTSLPWLLITAWALGAAATAIRWLWRWAAARAIANEATPAQVSARIPVRTTRAVIEPGVFGIFRPVLLLPGHIFQSLNAAQLHAIVEHEAAHVRRRDNLTAALHSLTEILFWFHPLVWWIGARLIEERERACDESVVRSGIERGVYAETIVSVCRLHLGARRISASGAGGGHLPTRIEAIMNMPLAGSLHIVKRAVLAAAAITAVGGPLALGLANPSPARAQDTLDDTPGARFAKASITLSEMPPGSGPAMQALQDRYVAKNVTVRQLVRYAYDRLPSQVAGGPAWVDTVRYDVVASFEPSSADPVEAQALLLARVRSLLTEHFHVQARVAKQPVYILETSSDVPTHGKRLNGKGIGLFERRGDWVIGKHASSASLVEALSAHLGSKVLDHTDDRLTYDFKMKWPARETADVLGNQLHEQLGLTLKSFPLELLMIERAEQPAIEAGATSVRFLTDPQPNRRPGLPSN